MKVFVAILFVIVSASARGSGPYLPSGWRPQGPAFFLPSEVAEQPNSPLKESAFQETEASGSDALREYGPPKLEEVFLSVNQALPDVVTEQSFSVQVKEEVNAVVEAVNAAVEAVKAEEQDADVNEETPTATESQSVKTATETINDEIAEVSGEQSTSKSQTDVNEQEKEVITQTEENKQNITTSKEVVVATALDNEVVSLAVQELVQDAIPSVTEEIVNILQEAVPTAALDEIVASTIAQDFSQEELGQVDTTAVVGITEEVVAPISLAEQELVQEPVVTYLQEVNEKAEVVNNVGEVIVNLENEAKAVETQAVENNGDISLTQAVTGALEQDPTRFLDYNPPGFAVYGPPLQDDLARLAAADGTFSNAFDNNGERRRRLSPKFRSSKNKSK